METLRETLIRAIDNEANGKGDWLGSSWIAAFADIAIATIAPQPGEQLYKKCLRCDGNGQYLSVKHSSGSQPCPACDGRSVVPTIVPSPDDGIAGVLREIIDRGWGYRLSSVGDHQTAVIWHDGTSDIAEASDAHGALTAALVFAKRRSRARVGSAADAEEE